MEREASKMGPARWAVFQTEERNTDSSGRGSVGTGQGAVKNCWCVWGRALVQRKGTRLLKMRQSLKSWEKVRFPKECIAHVTRQLGKDHKEAGCRVSLHALRKSYAFSQHLHFPVSAHHAVNAVECKTEDPPFLMEACGEKIHREVKLPWQMLSRLVKQRGWGVPEENHSES